jgi:hypothetical protein
LPERAIDALHTEQARGPGAALCALVATALVEPEPARRRRADAADTASDAALSEALSALVRVFGLEVGAVERATTADPRGLAARAAPGASHVWVCGPDVAAPLSAAQRFVVGRQAMALRLGVLPLLERPAAERRERIEAAVSLAKDRRGDERVRALAREMEKRLPRASRKALAQAVEALGDGATDAAERSLRALEWSCLRAGLLLGDDPASALEVVLGGFPDLDSIRRSPEALELLRFWVSPTRLVLARALEKGR